MRKGTDSKSTDLAQLVRLNKEGNSVTTSLIVAEVFGKEHRRVMQDVRELTCSEEFSLHNFVQRDYINERGQTYSMYEITKDGFSFLVNGYTGGEELNLLYP